MADLNHLFVVDIETWPFVSPGLHITEYSDNSLKSINVSSTENQSGIIDAATQGLTSVTTTQNAKAAACQTSNAAVVRADQALASARASYDGLPATASSQLKAAYQQVIASAQIAADYAHNLCTQCASLLLRQAAYCNPMIY